MTLASTREFTAQAPTRQIFAGRRVRIVKAILDDPTAYPMVQPLAKRFGCSTSIVSATRDSIAKFTPGMRATRSDSGHKNFLDHGLTTAEVSAIERGTYRPPAAGDTIDMFGRVTRWKRVRVRAGNQCGKTAALQAEVEALQDAGESVAVVTPGEGIVAPSEPEPDRFCDAPGCEKLQGHDGWHSKHNGDVLWGEPLPIGPTPDPVDVAAAAAARAPRLEASTTRQSPSGIHGVDIYTTLPPPPDISVEGLSQLVRGLAAGSGNPTVEVRVKFRLPGSLEDVAAFTLSNADAH